MTRIAIYVPCFNRKRITELCLPTLRAAMSERDELHLYDDGSTEFDDEWLTRFGEVTSGPNIGTEAQRRQHFKDFWAGDAEWMYLTDPDAIHAPNALEELLRIAAKHQASHICGYDTMAHVRLAGNTIIDRPEDEVIWRKVAPGISYLLSRHAVSKVMPFVNDLTAFDWQLPAIFGNYFPVTRRSVLDHLGWQGLRHPANAGPNEGDVARNPVEWLISKRAEIVAALSR